MDPAVLIDNVMEAGFSFDNYFNEKANELILDFRKKQTQQTTTTACAAHHIEKCKQCLMRMLLTPLSPKKKPKTQKLTSHAAVTSKAEEETQGTSTTTEI